MSVSPFTSVYHLFYYQNSTFVFAVHHFLRAESSIELLKNMFHIVPKTWYPDFPF